MTIYALSPSQTNFRPSLTSNSAKTQKKESNKSLKHLYKFFLSKYLKIDNYYLSKKTGLASIIDQLKTLMENISKTFKNNSVNNIKSNKLCFKYGIYV